MDKDTLRKQIFDEVHSQFENKLREAKRQKSQVEEELEASTEKWRAERRRLNTEIDRLESALSEARDTRKKASDSKSGGDSLELTKARAAADDKYKQAAQEWEIERKKLETEVGRLQRGVAELLERSNNPLRTNQTAKAEFEVKVGEAERAKKQLEDEFIKAKAGWEQEKLRMAGEMVKLRRAAPGKASSVRFADEDRYEELQKRLEEANKSKATFDRDIEKARKDASADQQKIAAELAAVRRELEESAQQFHKREAELREQLRDVLQQKTSLQQAVEQGSRTIQSGNARIAELESELDNTHRHQDRLEGELQKANGELSKSRSELGEARQFIASSGSQSGELQQELKDATEARSRLEAELSRSKEDVSDLQGDLKQVRSQIDALTSARRTMEKQLEEVLSERESLVEKLEKLKNESGAENRQLSSELKQYQDELNQAKRQVAASSSGADAQLREALSQKGALQKQLDEMSKERLQLVEAVETAKAEAVLEQRKLTSEISQLRESLKQNEAKLAGDLQSAKSSAGSEQKKLAAEVEQLKGELKKARETSNSDIAHSEQLREALQQRNYLQLQVDEAKSAIQSIRAEQAEERKKFATQLEASRTQVTHLERTMTETKDAVSSDVVDQLRKQYDEKIEAIIQEKTELSDELNKASAMLESERERFATANAQGGSRASGSSKTAQVDEAKMDVEVSRIQGLITDISKLIDDPATEFSTAIRKNVERAEFDAYLKGILFSLGRGKGM